VEPLATVQAEYFHGPGFFVRVGFMSMLAIGVLVILLLRLWSLQVLHGPQYAHTAAAQSVRVVPLPGARGTIVDSLGRPLADTEGIPVITADPRVLGAVGDDGTWRPSAEGKASLRRLSAAAHERTSVLVARIRDGLEREPYAAPVILPRASTELSFFLFERPEEFPGLTVETKPVRLYSQGMLGSEFLGLVGEISQPQLDDKRFHGYRAGELIGQSGLESTYDRYLRGGLGGTSVTVDAMGQRVGGGSAVRQEHTPRGLQLTIDSRLQRAVERAVRDGIASGRASGHYDARAGSALVMNAHTGAILAMASYPTFNQVRASHSSGYLGSLLSGALPDTPLLNRATQGAYPAGSTFKPIVAIAAMKSGLLSPTSNLACTGALQVGDTVFHNVDGGINAMLGLPKALAISCDTWFYRVGVGFYTTGRMNALGHWARKLGIAHTTGIDLTGETSGLLLKPKYEGDLVNNSIGQGGLLVSPLQLAVAYAAFANGGTVVRPHLGRAILTPSGKVKRVLEFPPRRHLKLPGLAQIREGLYSAAHDPGGTSASLFADFPVEVAGKTGTAQTPNGSDHSWYASWAPAAHPKIVVVAMIEHGGFGAQAAAPAAKEIYEAYFRIKHPKAATP
jgi:penicillin-binding protein 2